MSESAAAAQREADQMAGENQDDEEVKEGEALDNAEEEEEEEEDGEETFINNHDLIGVKGIIEHQRNEIEKKKVSARLSLSNRRRPDRSLQWTPPLASTTN